MEDPIVEEIRRYRMEHAVQYGNDLKRIVDAYQELEHTSGREYVHFEPRRISVKQVSESTSTHSVPAPYFMPRRLECFSRGLALLFGVVVLVLSLQSAADQDGGDTSKQEVSQIEENPKYSAVISIARDHTNAVEKERRTILAKWGNPRYGEPREARTFAVPLADQDRKDILKLGFDCLREEPADWKGVFIALGALSHDTPCNRSEDFIASVFRQPWPPDEAGWQAAISIGLQSLAMSDNRSARNILFQWATLASQDPKKRKFFPMDQANPNFDISMMAQTVEAFVHMGPVDAIVPFAQRVAKAHGPNSRYREMLESYLQFAERVAGGETNAMFRVE